jgi:magnesium transporter
MKVTCFAIEPEGGLRLEDESSAMAAWKAGGGPCWVDLSGGPPEAVAAWLTGLGLDSGTVEEFEIGSAESKVLPLADLVFVSYPVMSDQGATVPLSTVCLDRLVITVHEPLGESGGADASLITRLRLREGTTAGLVCGLSVVLAGRLRKHVAGLRAKGDALAGRMDPDPEAVSLAEILALKHRVLTLGTAVDEALAVLEVLKISKHPALPLAPLADAFQAAIETARATERDIDRLDRRAHDLQHRHEAAQQDKMNRLLGLLTVLSAIFMPLTLIAGIYGMNFEFMPELHWRYGYFVILAAMALIAGGLGWYFRARWWSKGVSG